MLLGKSEKTRGPGGRTGPQTRYIAFGNPTPVAALVPKPSTQAAGTGPPTNAPHTQNTYIPKLDPFLATLDDDPGRGLTTGLYPQTHLPRERQGATQIPADLLSNQKSTAPGYAQWKNFAKVIDDAIIACQPAGYDPKDHSAGISKMVDAEWKKLPGQIEGFEGSTTEV